MSHELRVNWTACTGRGLCHEILPELIDLDEWGYPLLRGPVPSTLLLEAREATRACPRLALLLVQRPDA